MSNSKSALGILAQPDPQQIAINLFGIIGVDTADQKDDKGFGTVYQASANAARIVAVGVSVPGGTVGAAITWIGPDISCSLRCGIVWVSYQTGINANPYGTVTFVVPPGWYYKVQALGSVQIYSWVEWDLMLREPVQEE